MRLLSICVVSLSVVCAPLCAAQTQRPLAVSPGNSGQLVQLAEACPTFSWAGVPTASAYRLVVYEVTGEGSLGRALVQQALPAGATTWSAPLGQCLSRGSTYAWTVGARGHEGEATWSEPVLFLIAPGPTEAEFEQALAVVQSHLATRSGGAGNEGASLGSDTAVAAGLDERALDPAPAAPAATQLSVDGNVDATSFTGDGSNLAGVATDAELASHAGVADVHHVPTTDTTCDGAACDGTNFTNVTAVSAASLTADGSNCPAGEWAAGVDASGNAQGCTPDGGIDHGFPNGNTRVGSLALLSNTTGSRNTASGFSALGANTAGFYNTASGYQALSSNTTGYENTASGDQALFSNTTGTSNTASGSGALRDNTTGGANTASGSGALGDNTTGSFNTATGAVALGYNTTGNYNTASGWGALFFGTTGSDNTATGYRALSGRYSLSTGSQNTATGSRALESNTTGYQNSATGASALYSNTTGRYNTASGVSALFYNTGGMRNTAVGHWAGIGPTTGSDNIFLGSGAWGTATDTKTIRIGGTTVGSGSLQQNRTFINGIRGVTTGVDNAIPVLIDSAGQLGTASAGGGGADADTLDGLDSTDLTTDAELTLHTADPDAHHKQTPVFWHRATAANTSGHVTRLDNPLTNGQPSALLLVTHNFSQDTASDRYETHPFGVWYDTSTARWTIYHEDFAAMPQGRAFNVIVYKP